MFWIVFLIGFLIICWPFILQILAPVGKLIIMITYIPVMWIFKLFRRTTTQAEEDKLEEDAAKFAALLLCLTILGLLTWWGFSTI